MTRTTLIIHGLRDTDQADDIWDLVDILNGGLKSRFRAVGIVMINKPTLLRHHSKDDLKILDYFCTMHVSQTGLILYSGVTPTPPMLCEV
jgi:hypothetical protein